ncbi:MAG: hypothetical protein A2W99_08690 [Bacteroidetes bacterium GWF2_33_16]|nr:MAG: hypothetical protein A2X00_00465 [Bacteroidetes bacterium GWE2_32_14]OFY05577.1 MAG: hypothetical protein A2W99_08690 [Bacteroidetes bacterium GWF2_33_16]
MLHQYPTSFARFYDVIYHHLRNGVDHEFYLNEIKQTKGKILEIGVGTGRFFADALSTGADIYGIDISSAMIDVLLGKIDKREHHRVSIQSITDCKFDSQFKLIIAPFRVMMHVLDKEEQLKAINNAYDHLAPGGKFIFDTFIPNLQQLITGLENQVDFEGEYESDKKLKRIVSTKPDLINQLINIHFRIEWDEDNKTKMEEWDVPLRYYFRYELEHLVERSKFDKYKVLGDYLGNELNNQSKEFVFICQK